MDWSSSQKGQLIKAILAIETAEEARRFLRDLMTEKEIEECAKRLQTAHLLAESVPYSVIEQKTGLSSTTIARVSKWFNGKEGGYKTVISKLHHHHPAQVRRGLS